MPRAVVAVDVRAPATRACQDEPTAVGGIGVRTFQAALQHGTELRRFCGADPCRDARRDRDRRLVVSGGAQRGRFLHPPGNVAVGVLVEPAPEVAGCGPLLRTRRGA